MDLNRLTRDELEAEARRAGVRDPHLLTRAQLIRAIESGEDPRTLDTAKALFRGVLGMARSLRKRPQSTPSSSITQPMRTDIGRSASERRTMDIRPPADAELGRPTTDIRPPTDAELTRPTTVIRPPTDPPAADAEAKFETIDIRPPERSTTELDIPRPAADVVSDASPRSAPPPPAPPKPNTTRKLRAANRETPAPPRLDLRATVDIRPPKPSEDVESSGGQPRHSQTRRLRASRAAETGSRGVTPELDGEPIATRTMARLLHDQGHHRRALAILEKLMRDGDTDPALEAEAAMIRKKVGAADVPLEAAALPAASGAELVTMVLPGSRVLLAWGIPEESLASAQALGAKGELVARAVVVAPAPDGSVTRESHDRAAEASGEWAVGPLPAGSYVTAAVGFRQGEQFVSIAHAPVLELD